MAAAALLLGLLAAMPLQAAPECWQQREERDRLMAEAMRAEIGLLLTIRRRLCPREEAAAEQAHAPSAGTQAAPAPTAPEPPLAYGAYIRCRERAEALLQRHYSVLFRNRRGFVVYTAAGARWAQAAEALQPGIDRTCVAPPASVGPTPLAPRAAPSGPSPSPSP